VSGPSGPPGASITGRTLWYQSLGAVNGAGTGMCLGHQESANATCPAGSAANFTYNYQVVTPGVLTRLWAELADAPAAGTAWTVTVRVNGVATTLTCVIPAGQVACESASTVAVVTGDQVQVLVQETLGNPTNTKFKTYVTFS
jgi:hypothetical protein